MKPENISSRQSEILDLLRTGGELTVQEIAARFQVTTVTARRDLDHLAALSLLHRTHGGAMPPRTSKLQITFARGGDEHLLEKSAIGREAARMVKPGMRIVLDTGTTTLEVARAIADIADLTVLTSSLAVAASLYSRERIELVLLGGTVRRNSPDLSGPMTEANLRNLRSELAILGADAMDRDGLYTSDLSVARISELMIAGARKVVVVADSSKFQRSSFSRFAGWEQVDVLVTDDALPADVRGWLAEKVKELRIAPLGAKKTR
jgi:DeoR/GlpR family transcriptional regulator of sugar metabolism